MHQLFSPLRKGVGRPGRHARIPSLVLSTLALITLAACSNLLPVSQIDPGTGPTPPAPPGPSARPGVFDLSDADVRARRESQRLEFARVAPDGGQILYRTERHQEVEFSRGRGRAMRMLRSGLMLHEADGTNRQVLKPEDLDEYHLDEVYWLDAGTIAWIADDRSLMRMRLDTGTRSVLFEADWLSELKQHGSELFFLARQDQSQRLVRLTPASGEMVLRPLPAGVYSSTAGLDPVSRDEVIVDMTKDQSLRGQYRVATAPPPPIADSFLISLATGRTERLPAGLDRDRDSRLSLSPAGDHLLHQGWLASSLHRRDGETRLQLKGKAFWYGQDGLLSLTPEALGIYGLADASLRHRFPRAGCSQAHAGPARTLIQCQEQAHQRVLVLTDPSAGPRALVLELSPEADARLGTEGAVFVDEPGAKGYTALYTVDDQGRPRLELQLPHPDGSGIVFSQDGNGWYFNLN